MILIGVLFSILIINRLFLWRKTLKRLTCRLVRCGRSDSDDDETVVGYNPDSAEKSASYTISSREFMAASNDPDLAWALELSMQLATDSSSNENDERQTRATSSGTRIMERSNRSIRREYGFERESSSRSSTSSNVSVRSVSDSSIFSSCDSTPLSTIREESYQDRYRRRGYYSLRDEIGNSSEIVLTRILNKRRSITPAFVEDSVAQDASFPTGTRPKQYIKNKSLETTSNNISNTSDESSIIPLGIKSNISGDSSSNYSSARSDFSRQSIRSYTSNTSSENRKMLRSNSVSKLIKAVRRERERAASLGEIGKQNYTSENS